MKSIYKTYVTFLAVLLCIFALVQAVSASHFSVKEYNDFHDVLHPLEHEALPAKDFNRIRSNAAEFVKRGKALVKVGVPKGLAGANVEEFRRELGKFKHALDSFKKDARAGTDAQLESSFSAVHDSFEMLVGMLPRK
jgi:hypothetical protein